MKRRNFYQKTCLGFIPIAVLAYIVVSAIVGGTQRTMSTTYLNVNNIRYVNQWKNVSTQNETTYTVINNSTEVTPTTISKDYSRPQFMTVLCLGRLGNQLFQYAVLISAAHRYGYTPFVSPKCLLNKYFSVPYSKREMHLDRVKEFTEEFSAVYSPSIETLDTTYNWTLSGFFQSWRYHDTPLLKSVLRFLPAVTEPVTNFTVSVNKERRTTVCLQVRRGDFLGNDTVEKGYTVATVGYIKRAMQYYRNKLGSELLFFVLSDDMEWCKLNIKGKDIIFSPFTDAGDDLVLMSLCDHAILTVGTFGWWGGWLCGGEVVYYRNYPRSNSVLANETSLHDYYPPDWVAME